VAVGRADSLERIAGRDPPWWLGLRLQLHRVVQRELPPVSGALLEGLLVGERRQLPATLLADFRTAGVFHILAVSGFNVALVAGAALVGLGMLGVPPRPAAAGALTTLLGFAAVVGTQASVLRATVMGGLLLAARLIARETVVWNGLAAALLVLLALAPDELLDPGLQLSFGATAGILHLGPPIRRRLQAWGGARVPRWLTDGIAVSTGAQLAVSPILVARWNQLSLIGVVANLVVVPLAALLTILGFLAALLAVALPTVAHLTFQSVWALLIALRWAVRGFAAIPGATVTVPDPPVLALVAMAAALVLVPLARGLGGGLAVAALALAATGATVWALVPDGRLRILVLDVGQGDAILVRGPDGQALLVDTGGGGPGRLDRGEHVVLPLLRRLGVTRLAALAVTHGDPDHAGALGSLLAGVAIDEVWIPAGAEDEPWHAVVGAAGRPRRFLARGDRLWLGPLQIAVLNPPPAIEERPDRRTTNNRSLVLRVEWGLAAAILTGDAEARAERAMLAAAEPLRAPVLKVGHHGSRFGSSPEFLQAVAPRIAAISVGARNPFGHPSPGALARLDRAGAGIYRTDLDGAVEITSDATRLWVRRWAYQEAPVQFALAGTP
jgi:competence protein ComEC